MGKERYRSPWWRAFEIAILVAALAGAAYLRLRVLLPAYVTSRSMTPSLLMGDYVLINRLAFRNRLPVPGEIVAFNTLGREQVWVKRAVAGPGDRVEVRRGALYRNGRRVPEPYILDRLHLSSRPVTVPPDHVFVLGDNRDNSDDSRDWGPLKHEYMLGKVFYIYWPRDRFGPPRATPQKGDNDGPSGK